MAVARSRYRVNKRKHAPKAPKTFNDMVSRLAGSYTEPQPPAYADSTKLSIATVWNRWTRFCQKVFEETDHFATADPVEVCKRHMHYEVARSFLEFSCEEGKFGSASSLFTFAKTWRMGVHLHTRHPVDQTVKMDMKNHIMNTLIEEYELDEMGKFKKVLNSDDILELAYHFWVLSDDYYPDERQRLQHWIINVFCGSTTARAGTIVESSSYFGRNEAIEYRDIYLFAMRDADNPPYGVKLGMHVQLRLLKGKRNRGNPPVIKIVERRDTPSFCLLKFILGVIFKDMPFNSPWIQDPMDLWSTKIPSRRKSVPIEWAPHWMNVPVLRRTVRDVTGTIVTSPSLAAQFNQMAMWNRRLGRSFGMEECLEFKILRRTAAAALSKSTPSRVRNKAMGHAHSGIYDKYYQSDIVDADIVAALLEKPSDQAAMRLLGHVSLTRDPNAPNSLTDFDRRQIAACPEVQEARARWDQSTSALRLDYVTVAAARMQAKHAPEVQARLHAHNQLQKEYKKMRSRQEIELLESRRADYFSTVGTICFENQYTGQEEPAGPATPVFQFSEREELTKLLFPSPDAKISYEQQIEDSCRLVRVLTSLCDRRQYPRSQRQPKDDGSGKQEAEPDKNLDAAWDVEPCFLDSCPEIFPVQCPGTQCLFCLGDDRLATEIRTRCFKNTYTLTRHVHAQHLRHIPPKSPIPCRHPHCQVVTYECKDVDQFKFHALQVHNIVHGV